MSRLDDLIFDLRHRTDTRMVAEVGADVVSANREHAVPYTPARQRPFRELLSTIELPRDSVFIDVGSGKGKVLMMASEYHFRKVIGIEFSESLCGIARANIERFARSSRASVTPEVVHCDAAEYRFTDENVVFMYNPFHTAVMETFIANLRESCIRNPREMMLIYHQPFTPCRSVIEEFFESCIALRFGPSIFRIYRIAAGARPAES